MDQVAPEEEAVSEEDGLSGEEIYKRLVEYLASRKMRLLIDDYS